GVPAYEWWLTQSKVFFLYLRLAVWPWPLLIHYQLPYLKNLNDAWMYVVPLLLMGIFTLVLLWRNNPLGFLGTWFFAILSPTFAIPVVTEMAAERRMYLALVVPVVIFVIGGYWLAGAIFQRREVDLKSGSHLSAQLLAIGAPSLVIALTFCLASA